VLNKFASYKFNYDLSMMRARTSEVLESKSLPVGFIKLDISTGFPLKNNRIFKTALKK
jgi:hypothetical protein